MKKHFFLFFSLLMVFSCKKESEKSSAHRIVISENLSYQKDKNEISLQSGKFNYQIKNSDLPFKRIIFLNSSLLGYVLELKAEQKVIAVTSPEYIYSEKIKKLIAENKIKTVGNEQKYDVEQIISLKPDAIFTNYVPNFESTYELLRKNGIVILFLNEYLEQNPLEKTAYIKVFGELLGKVTESEKIYNGIKAEYQNLKKLATASSNKPKVLVNEMYGNQWFVAGGTSNLAQFIGDANADYLFKNIKDNNSTPLSFEEVFSKSKSADYWVNVGNHLKKSELLQINASYSKMKVYQDGNLFAITGKIKDRSNDYFESGVVRADLVLKDYIKIFHPELLPDYQLYYMQKLK